MPEYEWSEPRFTLQPSTVAAVRETVEVRRRQDSAAVARLIAVCDRIIAETEPRIPWRREARKLAAVRQIPYAEAVRRVYCNRHSVSLLRDIPEVSVASDVAVRKIHFR